MYYSAIGLLAALVLCIVNLDILRDPRVYDKPAWQIYRKFLFAVLAPVQILLHEPRRQLQIK